MPEQSIVFDRAADYYDETRGFPAGEAAHIGAFIGERLPFQARVLEVGVGTGRIALPVAPYVSSYYGIDLSMAMMERLRAKQQDEAIFVAQADASQLPFPANSYDAAIAVHVFHLIPSWKTALAEVARVLKPGSYLFNCWGDNEPNEQWHKLWEAWEAAVPAQRRKRPGVDFDLEKDFLGSAGWRRVSDTSYRYQTTTSPGSFLDGVRRRILSSMWRLTDEELAAGIAAVEAVIAQDFDSPHDVIEQHMSFRVQAYLLPDSGTA